MIRKSGYRAVLLVFYLTLLLVELISVTGFITKVHADGSASIFTSKSATLRVSLPAGTYHGSSPDPWLNEGWVLYSTGTSWSFTVNVTQKSTRYPSYNTHLIIALSCEAYDKYVSLQVDGLTVPKSTFVYGRPRPYGLWTWPDDVYPTWYNDVSVNLGTIPKESSKIVTVNAVFSGTYDVKIHFDAYGKKTLYNPKHDSDIFRNPNSGDSTVLAAAGSPAADFVYSPSAPNVGETVTFNASLSYSPNGYIASYTWDFGDGNTTTTANPIITHPYSTSGSYDVNLTVTDNEGFPASTSKTISIVGMPTAQFTFSPTYPTAGETITFDASGSAPNGGTITSYAWDFESDGTVDAYGMIVTHSFPAFGNYQATLTVTDSEGLSDTETKTVQVRGSPAASFTHSPPLPLEGETVTLDASSSVPKGGSIVSYEWDFDDGNITTTASPIITHVYWAHGTYTVTLNITDSEGLWDVGTTTIRILAEPSGSFTNSPHTPTVGQTVTFDASSSIDPDGSIVSYIWNFGDGNTTTTSNPVITHVYSASGSYSVNLTVIDNDGLEAYATVTIDILDYPTASFTYSPTLPKAGETVFFDASSSTPFSGMMMQAFVSGGTIVSYEWNFGDGNITVTSSPIITHSYATYGIYTITLNVTDSEGLWDIATTTVQVIDCPTAMFTVSPLPPYTTSSMLNFDASASVANGGTILTYAWDFNSDGTVDQYGMIVTHNFPAFGDYLITLNVTDSEGLSDTTSTLITILAPPVAAFTYLPDTALLGNPVTFNASQSYDPDGTIVSYSWDFGDGNFGNGMTPEYTYFTTGDFTVTLTVTDDDGLTHSINFPIHVGTGPLASFNYNPSLPQANSSMTFDASDSYSSEGSIVSYSWNFGDGNTTSTGTPIMSHVYASPGNYTVTLNITDSSGFWAIISQQVFVSSPPPSGAYLESMSYIASSFGEVFDINVDIANVSNLYGFEFKLAYNTTLLDVIALEEGPFLQSFGTTFVAKLEINEAGGYVWIGISLLSPAPPAEGSGTLATITFRVTYAPTWPEIAECPLDLYDTKLGDPYANPIPHTATDGWYAFFASAPNPPTLMITPQNYTAKKLGETFNINIEIANLDVLWNLYGWEAKLYYNTTLLDVINVAEGPFLQSHAGVNGTFFIANIYENQGYVHIANLFLGNSTSPSGSGVLTTITFNATYESNPIIITSPLSLMDLKLGDERLNMIPAYVINGIYYAPIKITGRGIDVFTEEERWPDYTTDIIGLGPDAAADTYAPQENVTLYTRLTYNNAPVASKAVAFEVHSPNDDIVFTRQTTTNMSGIATITFRIPWPDVDPESIVFGEWWVISKASVAEMNINDTLTFSVGWLVRVVNAYTTDSMGTPKSEFARGIETVYLNLELENIGNITRSVYVGLVVYDELGVPVISTSVLLSVDPGTMTTVNFGMPVPSWAYVGIGKVYVNLYTGQPPISCGVTYSPEHLTALGITA